DDYLVEVAWNGELLWEWLASDHIGDFAFSDDARAAIYRAPGWSENRQSFDWLHINSASYVGPNRWYDAGDERFHPDNVIISSREASIVAIVARSGEIVWRIGPDYRETAATQAIGQIIGQHHPHIIPPGLPGAGNLLVFDNGGSAGYGTANPVAPDGVNIVSRFNSRVLEIDPVTLEVMWEYSIPGQEQFRFFSSYVSSAQRLPNGNTMITEGAGGRLFEITTEGKIVWEYVNPYGAEEATGWTSRIYRAYRVPYDWVPQLTRPIERPVIPPDNSEYRVAPQ
ncbi:MAG: aryl-sulfate sulfotransferase, partial [Gammaproteobacteria bacterium]